MANVNENFFILGAPGSTQLLRDRRVRRGLMLWVLICACAVIAMADQPASSPAGDAAPSRQIDLTKLGYQGLSAEGRMMTTSNVTINYVDDRHLLLTFNPKKLFQRDPACPPTHQDRIIQAQVVEIGTGTVVHQASWYVHDERRYLWPLGDGRFLLRRLNSLYEVDSDLHEKLLLESPKQLLFTSVTPDGKQIIVETAVDDSAKAAKSGKAKVKIEFLEAKSLAVQRTIRLSQIMPLDATSLGFADAVHSGKIWLIRFGSGSKDRSYITRVRSQCIPDLKFPTNNTMFVGRCSAEGSDYSVSIFTLTGHFLWREKWNQHRYEPVIDRSEDGSRVVISTLMGTAPDGTPVPEDQEWPQVQQSFRVMDAATGTPVLTTKAAAAILKGQNFALSPDGRQFAVLDGPSLEMFDLPQMSTDERAKYVALQADAPTLAAPAAHGSAEAANDEGEVFDAAAQSDSDEPPKPPLIAAPGAAVPATDVAGATASAAAAQVPAAQNGTPDANPTAGDVGDSVLTIKVASKTVVVDVVVTDSKGHPVKGLPAADFQLQEDGKAQRVNYFHEFTGFQDPDGANCRTRGPSRSTTGPSAQHLHQQPTHPRR